MPKQKVPNVIYGISSSDEHADSGINSCGAVFY